MNKISRRIFLKQSALTAATIGFPLIIPANVLGKNGTIPPSDRVNIGVISCGGRSGITEYYKRYDKSEVVAVCDPRKDRRMQKKEQFGNCADYNDFRELLLRDDVDAVHISTPDHWHVPISLAAARAGKDMYTEKPLGISIEQDLASYDILNKHKRIFQYGTQNRSTTQVRLGIELVLNGHIGDVKKVYVWCPQGETGGSKIPVLPVPEGFDYDLWLGPAPQAPFCKDRCYGEGQRVGIYHIYDYALGFIAGWGAHPLDQAQWWADKVNLDIPVYYEGSGKIPKEGLFDTVSFWDMTCTYANGFQMRFIDDTTARKENKIPNIDQMRFTHGTLFVGSEGWIAVSRGAWKLFPESLYDKAKDTGELKLEISQGHTDNFVDSVLERKQPISDLQSAIKSDIISHLCDISIRTGRSIKWDPQKNTIVHDTEAIKLMSRPMRAPWTI
jgi:predicted dehydrogenase